MSNIHFETEFVIEIRTELGPRSLILQVALFLHCYASSLNSWPNGSPSLRATEGKPVWFYCMCFQTLDNNATKLIDSEHYDSENIAALRDSVCQKPHTCACLHVLWGPGRGRGSGTKLSSESRMSIFGFADHEFLLDFCSSWPGGMLCVRALPLGANSWRIHGFCRNCMRTQMT